MATLVVDMERQSVGSQSLAQQQQQQQLLSALPLPKVPELSSLDESSGNGMDDDEDDDDDDDDDADDGAVDAKSTSTVPTATTTATTNAPASTCAEMRGVGVGLEGDRLGNYILGRTLGEGAFAKVKAARHLITGAHVAIKMINKAKTKDEYVLKHLHREGQLMRRLKHRHIITLYEILETDTLFCLVCELAGGGEVLDHIVAHGRLSEKEVRKYLRQLIAAVDHLHQAGVVHRDLKADNLLLDESLNLKLIDFGLANGMFDKDFLMTQCGSPAYTAPEVLGGKQYGPEVDIWSIGVNMYAMLTGRLPFNSANVTTLHALMLEQKYEVPDYISEGCKDLMSQLLRARPKDRITMAALRCHPWLNEGLPPLGPEPAPIPMLEGELDTGVLDHMGRLGFSAAHTASSVLGNTCNAACAVYHLFAQRRRQPTARRLPSAAVPSRPPLDRNHTLPAVLPSARMPVPPSLASSEDDDDEEGVDMDDDDPHMRTMPHPSRPWPTVPRVARRTVSLTVSPSSSTSTGNTTPSITPSITPPTVPATPPNAWGSRHSSAVRDPKLQRRSSFNSSRDLGTPPSARVSLSRRPSLSLSASNPLPASVPRAAVSRPPPAYPSASSNGASGHTTPPSTPTSPVFLPPSYSPGHLMQQQQQQQQQQFANVSPHHPSVSSFSSAFSSSSSSNHYLAQHASHMLHVHPGRGGESQLVVIPQALQQQPPPSAASSYSASSNSRATPVPFSPTSPSTFDRSASSSSSSHTTHFSLAASGNSINSSNGMSSSAGGSGTSGPLPGRSTTPTSFPASGPRAFKSPSPSASPTERVTVPRMLPQIPTRPSTRMNSGINGGNCGGAVVGAGVSVPRPFLATRGREPSIGGGCGDADVPRREDGREERRGERRSSFSGSSSNGLSGRSGAGVGGSSYGRAPPSHSSSEEAPSFLPPAIASVPPHQSARSSNHQHHRTAGTSTAESSTTATATAATTTTTTNPSHVPSRRYPLNPHMVSEKPPDAIFRDLQAVLRSEGVVFSPAQQPLCVQCVYEDLLFEAEVVKIPRLNMHGVHFRRVRGDAGLYQRLCTLLIDTLHM